ncbi:MAG: DUF4398 domain-containing protein [Deltaproteobacteria bacterium]|nr:DUF4398 domain-containing protein [Nannocystaceae bacterium]
MSHSHLIVALALVVPACASKTLPQQQLMDTQGAITSAEELGGDENPDAKLHLQYAREQLESAKKRMDDGDKDEAKRLLERAHADADLALTLARTEQVHQDSRKAIADVEALRSGKSTSATAAVGE